MAERFVIDASVAAKWFLKDSFEDHVELAEEVLIDALAGGVELHAPRLMSYEVCRLLWKACLTEGDGGSKRLERERAQQCAETLFDLPVAFAEARHRPSRSTVSSS
jgi:predicted nucleic acid-binding protein